MKYDKGWWKRALCGCDVGVVRGVKLGAYSSSLWRKHYIK